jgi:hypothetical protein
MANSSANCDDLNNFALMFPGQSATHHEHGEIASAAFWFVPLTPPPIVNHIQNIEGNPPKSSIFLLLAEI